MNLQNETSHDKASTKSGQIHPRPSMIAGSSGTGLGSIVSSPTLPPVNIASFTGVTRSLSTSWEIASGNFPVFGAGISRSTHRPQSNYSTLRFFRHHKEASFVFAMGWDLRIRNDFGSVQVAAYTINDNSRLLYWMDSEVRFDLTAIGKKLNLTVVLNTVLNMLGNDSDPSLELLGSFFHHILEWDRSSLIEQLLADVQESLISGVQREMIRAYGGAEDPTLLSQSDPKLDVALTSEGCRG